MTRSQRSLLLTAMFSVLAVGCSDSPAVNRVGVNVVDKALFTGSWYYSRTVIDVDYEAAGLGTYPGDSATDFSGGDLGAMPRIRWVIDEDTLYAFRDYELYEGINPDDEGTTGEIITHPVAAFGIESHFNIRRDYNSSTGEETNIIVENSSDQYWYETDYMRVDWSENQLPGYYGQVANLYEVLGLYNREPAPLFVQGQSEFPDSWQPQFHFMGCDGLGDDVDEQCTQADLDYANDYAPDELYHMSFVTQEILSPGMVADPIYGNVNFCQSIYSDAPNCLSTAVYIRNSFLKVSEDRQYVAENWNDQRFGRHGYFRLERATYDRSEGADDPSFGATDFLNYNANRQNIWYDWYDEAGEPVPYADRRVRPITWYTTPELPAHLVEPTLDLVSRWNEVFMRLVRNLKGQDVAEYPRMECQMDNPDGYCHCTEDPETGEVLNPTCPGVYDPFETPEAAMARGVTNPWRCHVDVPADAAPDLNDPALSDEDFYGWYASNFVGDECVVTVRMNTCNRGTIAENGGTTDGMTCEERGDARFKFLSYVDQPGTAFLGVATLRGDPVTGEIMTGDANIGGPALDGYRTSALRTIDAVTGEISDRDFLIGEDVRSYLSNLNNVQQPARPREDFSVASQIGSAWEGRAQAERQLDNQMNQFADRASRLRGAEGRFQTFADRVQTLVGSPLERQLFANTESLAQAGVQWLPQGYGTADIDDAILDLVSPLRNTPQDMVDRVNEREMRYGMNNVLLPNDYTDASVLEFAQRHADWPRARLEFALNQLLFYQTELHEMGHCLGLRHQFGASADTENYDDDYYYIAERIPYPDPAAYDTDGNPGFSAIEQAAFERDYNAAKERREVAGIDRWMNSSIMEYTGQWYERTVTGARGAGRYDHAAISHGYGDVVEIYDNEAMRELSDITPINTERAWVKYYQGGEVCTVDAECPFSATGAQSNLLLSGNMAAGLTQSCVPHPSGAAHGSICSNFDDDAAELITGGASNPRYAPVQYRFCTDDRVGTLGWCHRFDEGDSYREIVRNAVEHYERNYIFDAFRRYRAGFGIGTYGGRFSRITTNLMAVFGNLMYEYDSDPNYRNLEGAFGFTDHFLASADILNFYGRVLAQPAIGGYRWQQGENVYVRTSDRAADSVSPANNLNVPLGLGRYPSSEYQRGLTGIERIEVVGNFYDKIWAMQFLTFRGMATGGYGRDVPYWTNFYDLFPIETQQIFQSMILGEPEGIAARVRCGGGTFPLCSDPQLVYMDFYRGDCTEDGMTAGDCRDAPQVRYDDANTHIVDNGIATFSSLFATVYALAFIPVYWDTNFQNQVFLCIEGNGDCFDVGPGEVEGVDYVRYFSDRYGKTFIARAVEAGVGVPNQASLGFQMIADVERSTQTLDILRRYRGDEGGTAFDPANLTVDDENYLTSIEYEIPDNAGDVTDEIDRLDRRVRNRESFFFQLIELQRRYGIANYLGF